MKNLRVIWIVIFVLIVVFAVINIQLGPSKDLLLQNIEKQDYNGFVKGKIIDKADHFGNKILLNTGKQSVHWKFYMIIEIGDSVVKKKGLSKAFIFKRNGKVFTYDLVKNEKNSN